MKKAFAIILCAIVSLFAQPANYSGWLDNVDDYSTFKADSLKYGAATLLGSNENCAIIYMANDTSAAGYASDSAKFICGYRIGYLVKNSSSKLDTTWMKLAIADTFNLLDSAAKANKISIATKYVTHDFTGATAIYGGGTLDTANVTGYAALSVPLPFLDWGVVVQPWIKGLTGNENGSFLKVRSIVQRRLYINVRTQ